MLQQEVAVFVPEEASDSPQQEVAVFAPEETSDSPQQDVAGFVSKGAAPAFATFP